MKTNLKIISWNVNGIRAILKKDFMKSLDNMAPDILCLQETKAHPNQVEHLIAEKGYIYEFWNWAEKKGYSGTAIFSKIKPINVTYGIDIEKHDKEGRVINAEFENFFLINVYTPNSKGELERLTYRTEEWEVDFLAHLKKLEKKKPIILCGDLNVAHQEIDLKHPKNNMTTHTKPGNCGFTDAERERFSILIKSGFIDTFRELHPEKIKYSWWSYRFGARINNVGWRIDYFCISKNLKENLKEAEIYNEVMGSDHCPVWIKIKV